MFKLNINSKNGELKYYLMRYLCFIYRGIMLPGNLTFQTGDHALWVKIIFVKKTVNYIIILAKWHICKQKYFNGPVNLHTFLSLLKSNLELEKYILSCNGKLNEFIKVYRGLYTTIYNNMVSISSRPTRA